MRTKRMNCSMFFVACVTIVGSSARGQTTIDIVNLTANHIEYDGVSDRIFASIPSSAGAPHGNHIVRLNPYTGAVEDALFVGSEPDELAISDDGSRLYVELAGSAEIRPVDLAGFTALPPFTIGSDSFFGPLYAEDLAVAPGHPERLAVSTIRQGVSPRHGGVAIFDNGQALPNRTPDHTGANRIEFSDSASTVYGYNNETTGFGFYTIDVNDQGATISNSARDVISGFGVDIKYADGVIYASSGRAVDAAASSLLGTYGGSGPVEPDDIAGQVLFVGRSEISIYDQQSFLSKDAIQLPGISGEPFDPARFGNDGLAMLTTEGQVVFVRSNLIGVPEPSTFALAILAAGMTMIQVRRLPSRLARRSAQCGLLAVLSVANLSLFSTTCSAQLLDHATSFDVAVPVNDIVYDSSRDVLYASVPSSAGAPYGNSIITVQPSNGAVIDSIFVGSKPSQMAIAADNSRVYVGIDGATAMRYWNPASNEVGPLRPLLSNFGDPAIAEDLSVPFGRPDVVVVSKDELASSASGDLEVFGDGWSEPAAGLFQDANLIDFIDRDTLISFNNSDTSFRTQRWQLDGRTLTSVQEQDSLVNVFNVEAEGHPNGRIYFTNGAVVSVDDLTLAAKYDVKLDTSSIAVEPVDALNYTYFVGATSFQNQTAVLSVFDDSTFLELDSETLPFGMDHVSELIAAGTDRLALVTFDDRFGGTGTLRLIENVPVPEPTSATLLSIAAVAFCFGQRKRRRTSVPGVHCSQDHAQLTTTQFLARMAVLLKKCSRFRPLAHLAPQNFRHDRFSG